MFCVWGTFQGEQTHTTHPACVVTEHESGVGAKLESMADHKDDELPMIDLAEVEGWVVDDTDEDDPVLLMPDGTPIQTWRENYPYDARLTRDAVSYTHLTLPTKA